MEKIPRLFVSISSREQSPRSQSTTILPVLHATMYDVQLPRAFHVHLITAVVGRIRYHPHPLSSAKGNEARSPTFACRIYEYQGIQLLYINKYQVYQYTAVSRSWGNQRVTAAAAAVHFPRGSRRAFVHLHMIHVPLAILVWILTFFFFIRNEYPTSSPFLCCILDRLSLTDRSSITRLLLLLLCCCCRCYAVIYVSYTW